MQHDIWAELGLQGPPADERALKRAYAARLRQVHPEDDADGFQRLRMAYEHAQGWLQHRQWEAEDQLVDEQPQPESVESADASPGPQFAAGDIEPAAAEPLPPSARQTGVDAAGWVLEHLQKAGEAAACEQFTLVLADERMDSLDARQIFEDYLRYHLLRYMPTPVPEALLKRLDRQFRWSENDALLREQPRLQQILQVVDIREDLRRIVPRQRIHNPLRADVIELMMGPWNEAAFAEFVRQRKGWHAIDLLVTDLISDHREIPLELMTSKDFVDWWTGKAGGKLLPRPQLSRPAPVDKAPPPKNESGGLGAGWWFFLVLVLVQLPRLCSSDSGQPYRHDKQRSSLEQMAEPLSSREAQKRIDRIIALATVQCEANAKVLAHSGEAPDCAARLNNLRGAKKDVSFDHDPTDAGFVARVSASNDGSERIEMLAAVHSCIRWEILRDSGVDCSRWNHYAHLESERARETAQAAADLDRQIEAWSHNVMRRIKGNWRRQGLPQGLTAKVTLMPGEDGSTPAVVKLVSSGNAVFDESVENAVKRSDPLPAFPSREAYLRIRRAGGLSFTFTTKAAAQDAPATPAMKAAKEPEEKLRDPAASFSGEVDEELDAWKQQVRQRIEEKWSYAGAGGRATLMLRPADGENGGIQWMLDASGNRDFDDSLIQAVAQMGDFPGFPSGAAYLKFRSGGGVSLEFTR